MLRTKAFVDAQVMGHEIQILHGVAPAKILATCLARLVDLDESPQVDVADLELQRLASLSAILPRYANAMAQHECQMGYKYGLQ